MAAARRRGSPGRGLLAGLCLLTATALCHCFVFPGAASQDAQTKEEQALSRRAPVLGLAAAAGLQLAPQDVAAAEETSLVLNDGLVFAKASFGPQIWSDNKCRGLTKSAIKVGFRNFFSSVLARNQRGFAQGVQDTGIARSELFICGSVDTNGISGFDRAYRETKRGCDDNLKAFAVGGIDSVDMIMLDYPAADCEAIKGQWKAFEEMKAAGKTKSLAVSNFNLRQLDCLLEDKSLTPPTVNQLRFNAGAYDAETTKAIIEEHKKRNIVVQAWSPLGAQSRKKFQAKEIGKNYNKSASQVLLRWIVQQGATFTTQSSNEDHLAEDVEIFDFALTDEEMAKLTR